MPTTLTHRSPRNVFASSRFSTDTRFDEIPMLYRGMSASGRAAGVGRLAYMHYAPIYCSGACQNGTREGVADDKWTWANRWKGPRSRLPLVPAERGRLHGVLQVFGWIMQSGKWYCTRDEIKRVLSEKRHSLGLRRYLDLCRPK